MKRIITIAAIALAALFASSCGAKSNGPEGVIKKAFEAIQKHDYDGYAATFNISESDQKMLAGMLEEKLSSELDKKGGIDNYKITDIQIDGGVKLDNILACKEAGANVFVVGSAIFGKSDPEAVCREFVQKVNG